MSISRNSDRAIWSWEKIWTLLIVSGLTTSYSDRRYVSVELFSRCLELLFPICSRQRGIVCVWHLLNHCHYSFSLSSFWSLRGVILSRGCRTQEMSNSLVFYLRYIEAEPVTWLKTIHWKCSTIWYNIRKYGKYLPYLLLLCWVSSTEISVGKISDHSWQVSGHRMFDIVAWKLT